MKISFYEIGERGVSRLIKDTGWSKESGMNFIEQPQVDIFVELIDEVSARLTGNMQAVVKSLCSRCGITVEDDIKTKFEYLFRVGQDSFLDRKEVECSDEDCATVFIADPEIDLMEVLQEQLILSVPEKSLCSEDCKGLCFNCGTAMNDNQCNCAETSSNSAFAVLKKLKK